MNLNRKQKDQFIIEAERLANYIGKNLRGTTHFLCVDLFSFISNYITKEDKLSISEWFETQRPSSRMNKSFNDDKTRVKPLFFNCWWGTTVDANKQRVLFLKHLIKKLSR